MTIKEFITSFNYQMMDSRIAIVNFGNQVLCDGRFDEFTYISNFTVSYRSLLKQEVQHAFGFLYNVSYLQNCEIQDNSISVSSIQIVDVEDLSFPVRSDSLLHKRSEKPIITFTVKLRGIDSIEQLNFFCYCANSGIQYSKENYFLWINS